MFKKYSLILILLLAIFFRFFWLTKSPPALNWDEVSIGYNAYSILKTGRDEWGHFLPLTFKAYGEYKLPAMIYASIPAIALFGLNDFAVRFTPALVGVLSVYALYLFTKELFNRRLALFASFLMAISPWHVHLSRASFEAGLALLFLELSLLYFIKFLKKSTFLFIFLHIIFAVLAMYSYNSARIVIPLLWLSYGVLFLPILKKSFLPLFLSFSFAFVLLLPALLSLRHHNTLLRWQIVNFANKQGFIQGIGESRRYTPLPQPLPRLIHNKYTHYFYHLFFNYLKTFSTEFLFLQGSNYTQRSTQGMGVLYLFELPLLLFGFSQFKNKQAQKILYPWLFLAPIPSALTVNAPSSLRALSLLPALLIIESLGLNHLLTKLRRQSFLIRSVFFAFVIWNIAYFAYRLFGVYPIKYASDWQWGYKQAVHNSLSLSNSVNKIYFTTKYGEPYMYVLFYSRYDPHLFQTQRVERTTDKLGWVHVVSFGKWYFTDFAGLQSPHEILSRHKGRFLFVGGFGQLPSDSRLQPAFQITAPNWVTMFDAKIGTSHL